MRISVAGARRPDVSFWALAALLLLVFLTGGGSRSDIASLVVLRPACALLLGFGLWGFTRSHLRRYRFVHGMAVAVTGLVLLHLVPLPPAVWRMFPGRELIADIDAAAGLGAVWRPISLVPTATWNALFALIPPLAALILATRLNDHDRWRIAVLVIGIGLLSALVAALQLGGDPEGPLYLYRVTNHGSAVGLFANRNHQAVFLASLFPLLAAFASSARPSAIDPRLRTVAALAIGAFLLPLLLVTGSRNGLVTMVIGLASIPFLYTMPGSARGTPPGKRARIVPVVVGLAILALVVATVVVGRAVAIDRIVDPTAAEGVRYRAWGSMFATGMAYFPVGGGFGAFADLFRIHEPHGLLATSQFAHAHNDWLEVMITGGLPALLLLGIAVIAFFAMAVRWWRARGRRGGNVLLGGAGLWMVAIFGVASFGDYPLRVPSLMCLFCVIVLWISSLEPDRAATEGV
ncbi:MULTISPECIES: O-antigen ligase family protein [unclassified Sphingomonas]|uniref:O-antigen ligase family protein n=1 Tax=unclassified Sphingomonas TaxID=196159 RepID=UPI0006FA87AD|nr:MULTISPECIES: O-antigen ligase family protein [unclassified Sphingomonas]KQX19529.1 O-antigen polymerase [Sphingomonas sp. Root1294]KQY65730.1 O-antigen polymerase [Sphingomonas sp. Root50]KRB94965.1 O-antigen polymerase [Sphingomonas sp. Root720]